MMGCNCDWIGHGGKVDFLGPLDQFSGMDGKQMNLNTVKVNLNRFGLVNEKFRPVI